MIQNPIIAGKKLPELTNPAGAANIESGYEAIDGNGNKITGTKSNSLAFASSYSGPYVADEVVFTADEYKTMRNVICICADRTADGITLGNFYMDKNGSRTENGTVGLSFRGATSRGVKAASSVTELYIMVLQF